MTEDKLLRGERVVREGRHRGDPPRHGSIANVYESVPNHVGETNIQYDVLWDDTQRIEKGYLRIGLQREPIVA